MHLFTWQVGVLVFTDRMAGGSTCIYSHGRLEYLYLLIAWQVGVLVFTDRMAGGSICIY